MVVNLCFSFTPDKESHRLCHVPGEVLQDLGLNFLSAGPVLPPFAVAG